MAAPEVLGDAKFSNLEPVYQNSRAAVGYYGNEYGHDHTCAFHHGHALGKEQAFCEIASSQTPPGRAHRMITFRRRTFWIVFGIVGLAVAAILGGGIGGAISVKSCKASDTESTVVPAALDAASAVTEATKTVTATTTLTPTATLSGSNPSITVCPKPENTNSNFTVQCDQDYDAYADTQYSPFVVQSFEECMERCETETEETCAGVVMAYQQSDDFGWASGICWMKKTMLSSYSKQGRVAAKKK